MVEPGCSLNIRLVQSVPRMERVRKGRLSLLVRVSGPTSSSGPTRDTNGEWTGVNKSRLRLETESRRLGN